MGNTTGTASNGDLEEEDDLIVAAGKGDVAKIKRLVEQGADKETKGNYGYTSLLLAAYRGHFDVVNAFSNHVDVVKYLVEQGADKEAKSNNGDTALVWAAYRGHLDVVRYLVEQGADIEATNSNGDTALVRAFFTKFLDVVKYLIAQGANISAKDKNGHTALVRAIQLRDISMVGMFLENGADASILDNDGSSALIHLLQFEADEEDQIRRIVKLLLESGAPPLTSNNDGLAAKSIARTRGFHNVVDLIDEYAAKRRPRFYFKDEIEEKDQSWLMSPEEVTWHSKPLAIGGFGKVYQAKWSNIDVVVKEIEISLKEELKRYMKEVKLWSDLRHTNVVPFYGANHLEKSPFIVSEFAAEGTLNKYLSKKNHRQTVVWRKLLEVAVGLSYLHRKNIIHGDLKGNNIVANKHGTAMLTYFGLSFLDGGPCSIIMKMKSRLGAMQWRAPEYATDSYESVERS